MCGRARGDFGASFGGFGLRCVCVCGSTRQAFRAAARAELAEYYRLIAVLEAQAQVPMASALENRGENSDASSSYVSLRRISVWLAEPARGG